MDMPVVNMCFAWKLNNGMDGKVVVENIRTTNQIGQFRTGSCVVYIF